MSNDRDKIFIDGSWVASPAPAGSRSTNAGDRAGHGLDPRRHGGRRGCGGRRREGCVPGLVATSREERGKYLTRIARS